MKTSTIDSKKILVTILVLIFLAATSNLASAQFATGLNFDGYDDYVACPNISSSFSTGQVSGEAWVQSNTGYMVWGSIMKNWSESASGAFHFGLDIDGSTLSIYITQSNGEVASVFGDYIPSGSWHHVAFSADGSWLHLYVDGNESGTPAAYDGTIYTGLSATFIGAKPGDSQTAPDPLLPGFWYGSMDEIRIWNRGLSHSEIQDHMNCELTGSQTGLVAYYKLNQGLVGADNSSETSAQDASGNSNNATLNNFALNGSFSNWITGTVSCGLTYTYYWDADLDGYGDSNYPYNSNSPTPPTGYAAVAGDCFPNAPGIYPGAIEVCNGVDDNCDGTIDEGCVSYTYFWDNDGDGYGQTDFTSTSNDPTPPAGYAALNGDCHDWDASINPGATEVCNSVDDNCEGTVDEGCGTYTYYWDYDYDGYGESFSFISNDPTPPGGWAALDGDCNPWDASINPGATEVCNGVDDNCDGSTDDGCYTYYPDGDGDGYGADYWPITTSDPTPPPGYASNNTDCNDGYALINPGAEELCNTYDDNCNGLIDEGCTTGELPDFTKSDIYGVSHHFYGDLAAGNAVIIEFSTGWCGPSQFTEPEVSKIYDDICQGNGNIKLYDIVFENQFPGVESNDAYGFEYANHYSATYPVITGSRDVFISFAVQYSQSNIPWFLVVIPDSSDPANSTVHQIVGADPDLKNNIENILTANGYTITPPPSLAITVDGDPCGLPSPVTLTSNQLSGNIWSTGETTQEITITSAGTYSVNYNAGCGTISKKITLAQPLTGTLTSLYGNTTCAGGKGAITLDYSGGSENGTLEFSLDGITWDSFWPGFSGTRTFLNTWDAGTTVYFRIAESVSNSVGVPNCAGYSNIVQIASQEMTDPALEITTSSIDCSFPLTLNSSYTDNNQWSTGEITQSISVNSSDYYYVFNQATCGLIFDEAYVTGAMSTWYLDADNDGFGNASLTLESCIQPTGYVFDGSDCNDADASIHPSLADICNSIDDNCNGAIDEDCNSYTYYFDGDEDGFGTNDLPLTSSDPTPPFGYTIYWGDCQDEDFNINPGAPEICNGFDDNCDGTVDDGCTPGTLTMLSGNTACTGGRGIFSVDYSGGNATEFQYSLDGINWYAYFYGFSGEIIFVNSWDAGTTVYFRMMIDVSGTIFSDTVQFVSQEMTEAPLEITTSTDCILPATLTSSYPNGNLWSTGENTPSITVYDPNYFYVIGSATCGQVYDDININPWPITWYQDADGDGWGNDAVATESCFQPNGYVWDNTDCNDADASVFPYAAEVCNSLDDNCDGTIDEGCGATYTYYLDEDGDDYGITNSPTASNSPTPPSGYAMLDGDCLDSDPSVYPGATEVCNSLDDNCDGTIDEGVKTTFYADADGDGYGDLSATSQACSAPSGYVADNTDCDDTKANVHPNATEVCNSVDDNCDTQIDEGVTTTFYADADDDGYGNVSITTQACSAPTGYVSNSTDCDDTKGNVHPSATDICNSIDDNCDGLTDENAVSSVSASTNTPLCAGGTLQLSSTSTNGNSYSWTGSNGFTSSQQNPTIQNVTAVSSGTYTVTASNGVAGCSSMGTVSVAINAATAITTQPVNLNGCTGSSTTFTVVASGGNLSYQWQKKANGNTWNNISGATNSTYMISNLLTSNAGNYRVRINGSCGNPITSNSVSLTVNTAPTSTASSSSPICAGKTLSLTSSGGTTYSWSGPNGFSSLLQNATISNVTAAATGTYTVSVSNGSCTSTATTTVTVNASPAVTASSNSPICAGSTLSMTSSMASTYSWTGPNGFTSNQRSPGINNATAAATGTYSVTVTNQSGCSATGTTSAVVNATTSITTQPSNQTACSGSAATFSVAASGTTLAYQWMKGNTNIIGATNATYSISSTVSGDAGNYKVIVSGTCGSVTSTVVTLTVNSCGCPNATSMTTSNIKATSATLNWTSASDPQQWQVQYKKSNASTWTDILVAGSARSTNITGLQKKSSYGWQIRAQCNGTWTSYSSTVTFTTLAAKEDEDISSAKTGLLTLFPNPTTGIFVIDLTLANDDNEEVMIQIYNSIGQLLQQEKTTATNGMVKQEIHLASDVPGGLYMIRILAGEELYTKQLIVQE